MMLLTYRFDRQSNQRKIRLCRAMDEGHQQHARKFSPNSDIRLQSYVHAGFADGPLINAESFL